jgi:hypothetical protein
MTAMLEQHLYGICILVRETIRAADFRQFSGVHEYHWNVPMGEAGLRQPSSAGLM